MSQLGSPGFDLFGRVPLSFGGAFAADAAVLTFGGLAGGGVGLIAQQLSFAYQQQITRLFEVGSNNVYYVAGRSQGNASVARVLGPRPVTTAFYQTYGNVCNAATNTLVFQVATGCNLPGDTGSGIALALVGTVIMSVGFSVAAENMVVNEQLAMMYAALIS